MGPIWRFHPALPLAAAVLVLATASGAYLARGDSEPTAAATDGSTLAGSLTTPTPTPAGPLEIYYKTKPEQLQSFNDEPHRRKYPTRFGAILADGTSDRETPSWPGIPFDQYSWTHDHAVYHRFTESDFGEYSGCGFAGCSTTYYSSAAAGIVMRRGGERKGHFLSKGGYDHDPRLSFDGRSIAYLKHIKDPKGNNGQADVVSFMSIDGVPQGDLPHPPGAVDSSVAWSPDGRSVAVVRATPKPDTPSHPAVEVWDVASHRLRKRLAWGKFRDLAWSNDGTRVVAVREMYERDDPADSGIQLGDDLWILPLEGAPRRLTHVAPAQERIYREYRSFCGHSVNDNLEIMRPMWSPDDKQVAFVTNHLHEPAMSDAADIAVIDADGTDLRIVRASKHTECVDGYVEITDNVELLGWRYRGS